MKHSELSGEHIHQPLVARLEKSSIAFSWKMATERALQKKYTRDISLKTCNPDHQIEFPHECRDNPEHKLLKECHPEAKKRILEKFRKHLIQQTVPVVERPKRLNRN